jgi:peptidoglycan/xylan/chitin deacetylase (PgdA/CDA1 family)
MFVSNFKRGFKITASLVISSAFIICALSPYFASAATATTLPTVAKAKISFTFDDGLTTAYTNAAPTLAEYGLTGTDYVITGCVGMTKTPNTCRANTNTTYMTWAQIQALQNTYGWEIGSHTVDHDCLASSATQDSADCQKNTLTQAQVDTELSASQAALAAEGITATDFTPPYGDYNNMVLAQIAKYYATMRGFQDQNQNIWPYDDYLLNDVVVLQTTDTPAMIEADINQAITNNDWIILTFHNIEAVPSTIATDYEYGTTELAQIAAYVQQEVKAGLITNVHINQGITTSSTNLLPNGNFSAGIADGWTTDNPADVTFNTADNGSYPKPTDSIEMVSNSTGATEHLFSPLVAVNANTEYLLKNFLNVSTMTSGVVAYYIDEYNASGQWISGQYLKQETSSFVEDMNFAYTPSSPNVTQARLQIILSGTGITAYLANAQWFPLQTNLTTATNLMPNGTFTAGLSDGWTTDTPANITANSAGNGSPSSPTDSIKLTANTTAANDHLFSPQIAVSSSKSYSISSWLNIKTLNSGVVAFYIDEYNASGQWISGQYKIDTKTLGAQTIGFTYTPSSSNVTTASLQVIVVGNSGITAYLDNVDWYQN